MMLTVEQLNELGVPLARTLGVVVLEAGPDRVVAEMEVRTEICTLGDTLHGGAMMSLADIAGATGAFISLPEGAVGTTTTESKTNMISSPPVGMKVIATATPIHKGRTSQVWQTRIEREDGKLVALTTQTQLNMWPQG
ncbi:phenylacetic acid degradation-like protein [Glycocaulis alkaliphilus]|uniref:Phenylacetic acid degradation-like protein n=2 Tax=Glycocaulis alkaliphilus TaxID=1434191 RepID=A0A3T0EB68_9PROT|nr:PaaI family thioesterase [Glycocaulis alkaliphilus]AZU04530.1 phenylacetic acid degradation-like protein [Glycocaulis alkaliphilus]GGB79107.1 phenylacetic acid degradation protein [Glycocaulis alkaliphilus]